MSKLLEKSSANAKKLMPLSFLSEGEKGTVVELRGGKTFQEKMFSMGINPGIRVEVISGTPGRALLVIAGESRLALGYGLAQKINIEKQNMEGNSGK